MTLKDLFFYFNIFIIIGAKYIGFNSNIPSFEISCWENRILLEIQEEYFFENSIIDLWLLILDDLTSIGIILLPFETKKSISYEWLLSFSTHVW